MLRWLASVVIASLFLLNLALPYTALGRRGSEARSRAEIPAAKGRLGAALPELSLTDLSGAPFRLSDLRGHRVLLTFERSLDW